MAKEDLSGNTYGKLLVLKRHTEKQKHEYPYICLCQCGKECLALGHDLKRGTRISCGCSRYENRHKNFKSIMEREFDNFEILEKLDLRQDSNSNKKYRYFKCRCKHCGAIVEKRDSIIKSNHIKSCGCLMRKIRKIGQPEGEVAFGTLYTTYKNGAKRRNLEFKLTIDEFRIFTKTNCYYCNKPPSQIVTNKWNGKYIYNGIDRVDSNIGYIKSNCVSCCSQCNWMKGSSTKLDFLSHIKSIYKNLNLQNFE